MSKIVLHEGDNRDSLRRLIDAGVRVHSVVTDPPYGLVSVTKRFGKDSAAPALSNGATGVFKRASGGFMGQQWDASGIERDPEFWRLIWEILLPGGYVLAFSGARTSHWQACAMEQAGFIMHPMIGWCYGCLDDQTECLTERGWVHYTDLTTEDRVMQWDSATGEMAWVNPSAVHRYPFDGEMVTIENRHTRQVLTPNHRVYAKVRRHSRHAKPISYEVLEAAEVHRRPGNWAVALPMAGNLVGGDDIDPDYAYLVGWWLTDAWPHKDGNACMFSQCKPETLARLRAALEVHGASEYLKKSKNENHADEHTFYLTGPLGDRLRAEFPDRVLPWSVMKWSSEARLALYCGLMDGDGSQPKHQTAHAFWSQNQERRDVFVALALSLGIRAYEDAHKGVVYVNGKTATTEVQGKHRPEKVRYQGEVWCVTVSTGAFVVRRQGRPFITGNSGFPKAHNAARAVDRALGVEPTVLGTRDPRSMYDGRERTSEAINTNWREAECRSDARNLAEQVITAATTPEAAQWEGWAYGAQSLKPAFEPIYMGQKPFSEKNGALNLLKHGVGAVNIDGCRVPTGGEDRPLVVSDRRSGNNTYRDGLQGSKAVGTTTLGRHPANLLHDGSAEVIALFPDSKGQQAAVKGTEPSGKTDNCYGEFAGRTPSEPRGDSGSAARFFNSFPVDPDPLYYHAKASKADRAGSKHPTVKPVRLMEWLVTLVTPPGGTVLDPFGGSGTTGQAARNLGFDCILMEAEPQFIADIKNRFGLASDDCDLFSEPSTFDDLFG